MNHVVSLPKSIEQKKLEHFERLHRKGVRAETISVEQDVDGSWWGIWYLFGQEFYTAVINRPTRQEVHDWITEYQNWQKEQL